MVGKITRDVIESHLRCKLKADFKLAGKAGDKPEYARILGMAKDALAWQATQAIVTRYGERNISQNVALTYAASGSCGHRRSTWTDTARTWSNGLGRRKSTSSHPVSRSAGLGIRSGTTIERPIHRKTVAPSSTGGSALIMQPSEARCSRLAGQTLFR